MTDIAGLISNSFINGMYHPGNDKEQKPSTIHLPLFRMAGQPPELYQQTEATVKMMGEAIVWLINNDGKSEIIDKDELAKLREDLSAARTEVDDLKRKVDKLRLARAQTGPTQEEDS